MRIRERAVLSTIVLVSILLLSNAAVFTMRNGGIQDQRVVNAIVMFRPGVDVNLQGINIIHEYKHLNGIAGRMPIAVYNMLKAAWFVSSIQLDHEVTMYQDTLDWGVDDVDAEQVWGGAEDAVDVVPGNVAGTGVNVAILDTGIDYTHPDLDAVYKGGYDFVDDDSDPKDQNGHGTHCAGIVAAEDNGDGVIGVAPKASIYAVRVLDAYGSGSTSDIIAGIDWAIDHNMDVISMSLGGGGFDSAFNDAINRAYDAGIVVVAASGNDGKESISYPAAYDNAIAVGAIDSSHNLADFSNYGPEQEVVAPGVDIYSTMPTYTVTLNYWWYGGHSKNYDTMSGTSMATPMVAGVVALILSANPDLTPAEVRDILHTTSIDLGSSGWDKYFGYGEVNAKAAVDNAGGTPPDTTPPAKVTGLTTETLSHTEIKLTWNANSESDLDHYNVYRDGTKIAETTSTTYTDTGLSPETTYTYEVSAVDTSNNEGEKSDPASATTDEAPPDTTPPAKVTGLNADPLSQTEIKLTWNANSESDLDHYNVYRDGVKIAETTSTTYTDTGLSPETTYTYEVSAVDTSSNEGEKSDPASATTLGENTMHVAAIDMWYEKKGFWIWTWYDVYTKVTVHDSAGSALSGVTVYLDMTLPDSSHSTGNADTGTDGAVTFVYQYGDAGTYTSTVTNLVKSGYTYSSGDNAETSETLSVP
ncbi:MAG: S8 family serine peptidase [Candidatus Thorarchaeota archaeon]|nr:S8 family serine peptidase [Candidatus Thorarchaeota archaeon]